MLKDWLVAGKKHGRSQKWLANLLGVRQPTVFRWLTGENVPNTEFRFALQYLTRGKIKVAYWFTDEAKRIAYRFRSATQRKAVGGGCA